MREHLLLCSLTARVASRSVWLETNQKGDRLANEGYENVEIKASRLVAISLLINLGISIPTHAQNASACHVALIHSQEPVASPRPPEPPERTPILSKEQAQEIVKASPKIGDYALMEIDLSAQSRLRVVVDTKADWLLRAAEAHAGKAAAQLEQKSIKAFLEHLAEIDLKTLLTPKERVFRADIRDVRRDHEAYYLEELMASSARKDLVIALIGQSLFENYVKKDVRIVRVTPEGSHEPSFGLMILNGSPEIIVPGRCANAGCGKYAIVAVVEAKVNAAPAVATKTSSQFDIIDLKSKSHTVNVLGRSATERLVKEQREAFEKAGPDDLVPVEIFILTAVFPSGTTAARIGDSWIQFTWDGWTHSKGIEGIKGSLFSNPYQRAMTQIYAGFNPPPFNVGITLNIPKSKAVNILQLVDRERALPADQQKPFDIFSNNCVHGVLDVFAEAGAPLGNFGKFTSFSSTLFQRSLLLNSPYPVSALTAYTFPGTELAPTQLRSLFPQMLYRSYSIKGDYKLVHMSEPAHEVYKEAVLLGVIAVHGEKGVDAVQEVLKKSILVRDENELQPLLTRVIELGWVKTSGLELTDEGQAILAKRAVDYDLSAVSAR